MYDGLNEILTIEQFRGYIVREGLLWEKVHGIKTAKFEYSNIPICIQIFDLSATVFE